MKTVMDQQKSLINLILQKMEIKTEENDIDKSISSSDPDKTRNLWSNGLRNVRLRNFMLYQLVGREDHE